MKVNAKKFRMADLYCVAPVGRLGKRDFSRYCGHIFIDRPAA